MKKTAFKTFVCSFVFSLFILFVINGLFFYTPQNPSQKTKIPSKNISLFFAGEADVVQSARIRPIKKIALTVPSVRKNSLSKVVYAPSSQPLPSIVPQSNSESAKPTQEDLPIFDDIPLEIAQENILPQMTELVSADFEHIMKTPPSVFDDVTEFSPNNAKDEPLIASKEDTQYSVQSSRKGVDGDEKKANTSSHEPTPLVVAQEDIQAKESPLFSDEIINEDTKSTPHKSENSSQTQKEEQLLIPLQKDFNAPGNKAFAVAKAAQPNELAMVKGDTPLGSLTKTSNNDISKDEASSKSENWQDMSSKVSNDTPWIAAKGTKFPKNSQILDEKYYKDAKQTNIEAQKISEKPDSEVKLAAEMVQNILIPIPEDILKEDPLIPQLEASPEDNQKSSATTTDESEKAKVNTQQANDATQTQKEKSTQETKSSLIQSIASLFSGKNDNKNSSENNEEENIAEENRNSFVDAITGRIRKSSGDKPTKILPAEMRLAFQPNRAEISGVTLKWLQAFANKVNSDRSVILEIRIDGTSSYELQQKRLNLLHNILTNKGVDYHKINTVFTTREPNSFIIRTVRINNNLDKDRMERSSQASYYQAW